MKDSIKLSNNPLFEEKERKQFIDCKHCGGSMEYRHTLCRNCGKENPKKWVYEMKRYIEWTMPRLTILDGVEMPELLDGKEEI